MENIWYHNNYNSNTSYQAPQNFLNGNYTLNAEIPNYSYNAWNYSGIDVNYNHNAGRFSSTHQQLTEQRHVANTTTNQTAQLNHIVTAQPQQQLNHSVTAQQQCAARDYHEPAMRTTLPLNQQNYYLPSNNMTQVHNPSYYISITRYNLTDTLTNKQYVGPEVLYKYTESSDCSDSPTKSNGEGRNCSDRGNGKFGNGNFEPRCKCNCGYNC